MSVSLKTGSVVISTDDKEVDGDHVPAGTEGNVMAVTGDGGALINWGKKSGSNSTLTERVPPPFGGIRLKADVIAAAASTGADAIINRLETTITELRAELGTSQVAREEIQRKYEHCNGDLNQCREDLLWSKARVKELETKLKGYQTSREADAAPPDAKARASARSAAESDAAMRAYYTTDPPEGEGLGSFYMQSSQSQSPPSGSGAAPAQGYAESPAYAVAQAKARRGRAIAESGNQFPGRGGGKRRRPIKRKSKKTRKQRRSKSRR
jgi:hypothetical protein